MKFLKLFNLTFYLPLLAASTAAMSGVLQIQASVLAAESNVVANLNYQQVSQATAIANSIKVSINPGRIAVIDFSATDEAIAYIGLGDASRIVYNTDFPIESGTAQTIFLLPIEELEFPGATTTKITNLVAKTVDGSGVSRVYNFQIEHSNSVVDLGIKITPQTRKTIADIDRQTIKVSSGRAANLDDVARGLTLAIGRGFTTADDPVVTKIRRFIALARNSDLSVIESAQAAEIDLAVISSLAEMALDQFSLVRHDGNSVFSPIPKTEADLSLDVSESKAVEIQQQQEKTSGSLQRLEGDRGNEIEQELPNTAILKQNYDRDLVREKFDNDRENFTQTDNKDKPAKLISDSSEERAVEIESNVERQSSSVSETIESTKLINRAEDLSIYLAKQSPVKDVNFDKRVNNLLKAHDLYFGWQKVVRQRILDIDEETQTKVNRAISLVRRGSPLKSALFEADIDMQVASFLLAISQGDTEALSSLSKNVSRVGE
ncbi:hypothetical protein Sta7437_4619 (plasmid) [Stanieria cyanosphaera PCC 7437]|uniref:Uncharacterized protein n=1 Tax=Stanieria cyanosphaera (strain ATCC 29371 / PCC 7437) TaxID=111780 RepID=K9Y276_STAC7|nr:hypothetical protein [Stanieria cyanosphaera]AFZ38077.1 hypothetical protein Sta7437_4619 [Stanieria cyanosphaera PCC 7437]